MRWVPEESLYAESRDLTDERFYAIVDDAMERRREWDRVHPDMPMPETPPWFAMAARLQNLATRLRDTDERRKALLILADGPALVSDWTGVTPFPPHFSDVGEIVQGRYIRSRVAIGLRDAGLLQHPDRDDRIVSITETGRREPRAGWRAAPTEGG